MMTSNQSRAPHHIELRLNDINQLFNSMDPSPFHEKELDAQAEEFIVSWATEFTKPAPLLLTIYLGKPLPPGHDAQAVKEALRNYFSYRTGQAAWQDRQLLREGLKNLAIGLAFLATCLFAAQFLGRYGGGTFIAIVRESLIIGGWVAMWRPMEIFLYERWPIKRKQKLYSRLSQLDLRLSVSGQNGG